jgi:hypothetical protein
VKTLSAAPCDPTSAASSASAACRPSALAWQDYFTLSASVRTLSPGESGGKRGKAGEILGSRSANTNLGLLRQLDIVLEESVGHLHGLHEWQSTWRGVGWLRGVGVAEGLYSGSQSRAGEPHLMPVLAARHASADEVRHQRQLPIARLQDARPMQACPRRDRRKLQRTCCSSRGVAPEECIHTRGRDASACSMRLSARSKPGRVAGSRCGCSELRKSG